MGVGAWNICGARRRTDVDRKFVKPDAKPIADQDALLLQIEAGDFAFDKSCASELAQWTQIDMRFLERIMAGDVAWQHAGIRGPDVFRDERQPHTGQRSHAEHLQDGNVRMSAADEDEVFQLCSARLV